MGDLSQEHQAPLTLTGDILVSEVATEQELNSVIARMLSGTTMGQHLYYNASSFDGWTSHVDDMEDAAIDAGIEGLLPGQPAFGRHVSPYVNGINGVAIDVSWVSDHGAIGANDLSLRMSNPDDSSQWVTGPVPVEVKLVSGAGINGSDRLYLVLPNDGVVGRWLEVTLKATAATGLYQDETFLFGNLPGDANGDGRVDVGDLGQLAGNWGFSSGEPLLGGDFNADGLVDVSDLGTLASMWGASISMPVASKTAEVKQVLPVAFKGVIHSSASLRALSPSPTKPEPASGPHAHVNPTVAVTSEEDPASTAIVARWAWRNPDLVIPTRAALAAPSLDLISGERVKGLPVRSLQ
jgi:hypothetical protein